jgi:hypothetical protein
LLPAEAAAIGGNGEARAKLEHAPRLFRTFPSHCHFISSFASSFCISIQFLGLILLADAHEPNKLSYLPIKVCVFESYPRCTSQEKKYSNWILLVSWSLVAFQDLHQNT